MKKMCLMVCMLCDVVFAFANIKLTWMAAHMHEYGMLVYFTYKFEVLLDSNDKHNFKKTSKPFVYFFLFVI